MKKIILIPLLLIFKLSFSQSDPFICGVSNNQNLLISNNFSYSTDPVFLSTFSPIVFNIYYWQVNDPSGNNGPNGNSPKLTENEALASVAYLNQFYNQYNIFFKYRGIDEFNSPPDVIVEEFDFELQSCSNVLDGSGNPVIDIDGFNTISSCQTDNLFAYALSSGHMNESDINIYVPFHMVGLAGKASSTNPKAIMRKDFLTNYGMIHEMGHILNLAHTQQYFRSVNCEHVTRDETDTDDPLDPADTYFNAKTHGDRIVDTAAVPDFLYEEYWELIDQGVPHATAISTFTPYKYIDTVTCEYIGSGSDCETVPVSYDIYQSDITNIMSYTHGDCASTFTTGQAIRMRESIVDFWFNYGPKTADNGIASLYEPYKGNYPDYYPYPNPWVLPHFQPGFEYFFIECDGEYPQPAPYNEAFTYNISNTILSIDKDESDYSLITHPNHSAIYIKHEFNGASVFPQPQKCYNNYNSPPFIGGTLIQFNDNVINENVTITEQDSISINDSQFINNLQPGLYNVIKEYESGGTEETLIFKESN